MKKRIIWKLHIFQHFVVEKYSVKKVNCLKEGGNARLVAEKFPIFGESVPYYRLLFIPNIFNDIFDDAFVMGVGFDKILYFL